MKPEEKKELKEILKNSISTAAFAGMIFNATLTEEGSKFDIKENIIHALRIKVKMRELAGEDDIEEEDVKGIGEEVLKR